MAKHYLITLGLLAAAVAVTAQGTQSRPAGDPRTLEAERIVIRDQEGRIRIELGCAPNSDTPAIRIRDERGRSRILMYAHDLMAKVDVNATGKGYVSLAATEEDFAFLSISSEKQALSVRSNSIDIDEIPAISPEVTEENVKKFLNRKSWLRLSGGPDGCHAVFSKASGTPGVMIDTASTPANSRIAIFPPKSEVVNELSAVVDLSADETGAHVSVHDPSGKARAVLGSISLTQPNTGRAEDLPESSLTLFDKAGKLMLRLPAH